MRVMPFMKRKKGIQFAGVGIDSGGGGDTSALANKTDLTAIILTGTTNTSGDVISADTWFYLNGTPCVAKVDIASGATFTEGTNYEEKTVGSALSELNSNKTNYYNLGSQYAVFSSDVDFVIAITNYIKTTFGSSRVYATVKYERGPIYIGQLVYDPSNNGYISILAHTYESGETYHFGISNGTPFYEEVSKVVRKENPSPVTISLTSGCGLIIVQETVTGNALGVYAYSVNNSAVADFVELKTPSSTLSYSTSGTSVTFTASTGANILYTVI